jgi:subtilase family serine protease
MHRHGAHYRAYVPLAVTGLVLLLGGPALAPLISAGSSPSGAPTRSGPWATDAVPIPSGAQILPVNGGRTVDLTLTLAPSNASALASLDAALSDPRSPSYHRFLSESTFERWFSPAPSHVAELESYFALFGGGQFALTPDRMGLHLRLPVSGAERALGVTYHAVRLAGSPTFYTTTGAPTLPGALASEIVGIGGLTDLGPAAFHRELRSLGHAVIPRGSSPGQIVVDNGSSLFTGSDFVQAYRENLLFPTSTYSTNASFANSSAIATILMSGFNDSRQQDLPPWDPAVVRAYFNDTFPPSWPLPIASGVPIGLDSVVPPLPGALPFNDTSGNEAENSLDLEMAGSLAPGATVVNFYFAASLFVNSNTDAAGLLNAADNFAQCLAQALTHSYGTARLTAVTNSYGLPDLIDSLWNSELAHAAAIGVTVVAASGDQGNAPSELTGRFQGPDPTWPGSAAYDAIGTIAVGGMSANITGTPSGSNRDGVLTDPYNPFLGGFTGEIPWYDTLAGPGNISGSEGGVSPVTSEPTFQRNSSAQPAIVNATVKQGVTTLGRAEPDLSFPANNTIAYVAADATEIYYDYYQGTSIASPVFAGLIAEMTAVAGHPFGYLDPELYRIASYYAANPGPSNPFPDIVTGGNFLFSAGAGWDPVTGHGTMDPVFFLQADATPGIAGYVYTGPSPGLPPPKSPGSPNLPGTTVLILFVLILAVIFAVLAVLVGSRPKPQSPYSTVPPGYYAPTPGGPGPAYGSGSLGGIGPPPSTFLCPYCGSVRPAEPVRCPACGAF